MSKILVTCPPMLQCIEDFSAEFDRHGWDVTAANVVQTLSVDELVALTPGFDGWIIGDDPATSTVIGAAAAGNLRAAVKWGVGVDNVDFAAFEAHNISITNTPGMFGNEVADLALCYVTGLARDAFRIHTEILAGGWPKPAGMTLANKRCALVGFGDIGQNIARRLVACGMHIQVFDPFADATALPENCELATWPDTLPSCDFLVLACALTPDTASMINVDVFEQIQTGTCLVNVSRGGLIDESALLDALASGKIARCALDVFEEEPLGANHPLRQYPGNIFGSHNGSNTKEAVHRTSLRAIELLAAAL